MSAHLVLLFTMSIASSYTTSKTLILQVDSLAFLWVHQCVSRGLFVILVLFCFLSGTGVLGFAGHLKCFAFLVSFIFMLHSLQLVLWKFYSGSRSHRQKIRLWLSRLKWGQVWWTIEHQKYCAWWVVMFVGVDNKILNCLHSALDLPWCSFTSEHTYSAMFYMYMCTCHANIQNIHTTHPCRHTYWHIQGNTHMCT